MPGIQLSKFVKKAGILTKRVHRGHDGKLQKSVADCVLSDGHVETISVGSLRAFGKLLTSLEPNEALAYGVCRYPRRRIVTQTHLREHPSIEAIARTRDHFGWGAGPGLFMLDYDPEGIALGVDELVRKLRSAVPELAEQEMLWRPSASSCIHEKGSGRVLADIQGQRLYMVVDHAAAIPTIGRLIYQRCWLGGLGWIKVSKAGTLLDRSIIDAAIYQPERLDFAAGAVCGSGLVQKRPAPRIVAGARAVLAASDLKALSGEEVRRVEGLIVEAKRRMEGRPEVAATRTAYVAARAASLAERGGIPLAEAERILHEAISKLDLHEGFVLHSQAYGTVTVGEVLDNAQKFHQTRFADPVEPDYQGDDRVAWANLHTGGTPQIYSHAHGGIVYTLRRKARVIRIAAGEEPRVVDESLDALQKDNSLFEYGAGLVRVSGQKLIHVSDTWLLDRISRLVHFDKFDKRSEKWLAANCPQRIPQIILAKQGERDMPELRAVITAPTMRLDGSILETPGFDPESRLLLITASEEEPTPKVNPSPTVADVREAFDDLWSPFTDFPFAGPLDKAIYVAALMTAVVRRSLRAAPAFAFDAPSAGSGKTLLARCVSVLSTGQEPGLMPPTDVEEEMRKRLFAKLREGAGVILMDNVEHRMRSEALAAFLTSLNYSDRVLGESRSDTLPNTALVLITGNNLCIDGDLGRRVLKARIDPRMERPFARAFALDPFDYTQRRRMKLTRAVLTILRGYQVSGRGPIVADRTASYEQWSDLVRNAVLWLGELGIIDKADPVGCVDQSMILDSDRAQFGELLEAWQEVFGNKPRSMKEVTAEVGTGPSLQKEMAHIRLANAVADIVGVKNTNPAHSLGIYLQRRVGQVVGGYRLERGKLSHGIANWIVRRVVPPGVTRATQA